MLHSLRTVTFALYSSELDDPFSHPASQDGIIIALASGDVLLLDCFQDPEYPAFLSKASLLVKGDTHPSMCWHRGKCHLFPVAGFFIL